MLKQSDSHVKKYLERAFERKKSVVICIYNEWTHPSQIFFFRSKYANQYSSKKVSKRIKSQ